MNRRILITFLMTIALGASVYAMELKIGVVNLQRALNETEEGKVALKELEGKLKIENNIMKQKQDELKQLQDELNSKGFMYSDAKKVELEEKFRMLRRDLERYQKDKKEEFILKQRNFTSKIMNGLIKVLGDYAKVEKFDMVLEASQQPSGAPGVVIFSSSNVNITDKIIELYNEKSKEEAKK